MTNPTPHGQVPEALQLADEISKAGAFPAYPRAPYEAAAAEPRRLHAQVAALTAAPQGVAYAELPEPLSKRPSEANTLVWVADPISSTGVRGVFVDDITCLWWWGAGLIFQKEVDASALALRMRSAIAPHGQAPAGAAPEPIAYLHDDGYWTPAKTAEGRKLNDRLHFAGSPKIGVHLAPTAQPTPAAGVTVEQVEDAIGLQSTAWDTIGAEKIVEAVLRLMNGHAPATQQAVSSAVLKAIRKANMQLVRTGDNAFMLVPYKAATAQAADSQPAPHSEPWYGHQFKEVRRGYWQCSCGKAIAEAVPSASKDSYPPLPNRYAYDDDGEEMFTADQMRAYVDADRAARAPADSVLEDAARWQWLADYLIGERTDLDEGIVACATIDALRQFADAARKQGANHD